MISGRANHPHAVDVTGRVKLIGVRVVDYFRICRMGETQVPDTKRVWGSPLLYSPGRCRCGRFQQLKICCAWSKAHAGSLWKEAGAREVTVSCNLIFLIHGPAWVTLKKKESRGTVSNRRMGRALIV